MKIILEFNSMEEHDEYVSKEYEKQYCVAHQLGQEREFDKDVSLLSEEENAFLNAKDTKEFFEKAEITNREKYKDEIDKMDEAEPNCAKGVDVNTKAPVRCYSIPCYTCLFNGTGNDCSKDFDKWLSQPYKENENVE